VHGALCAACSLWPVSSSSNTRATHGINYPIKAVTSQAFGVHLFWSSNEALPLASQV
jgi:hypothetical protein